MCCAVFIVQKDHEKTAEKDSSASRKQVNGALIHHSWNIHCCWSRCFVFITVIAVITPEVVYTSRSLDSHHKKNDVETHRSCRRLDYKLSPLKTRRGLAVKASFTKNVSTHKISPNTRYVKYRTTRYVRARFAGFGSATWNSTNLEDTSAICCKMLAPFFTFADFGVSLCRELEWYTIGPTFF